MEWKNNSRILSKKYDVSVFAPEMNKELDYQLAPVMSLYKSKISVSKESKIAYVRTASSTVSFISFLATQGFKKKTLTEVEIMKAACKIEIPGLAQAVREYCAQMQSEQPKSTTKQGENQNNDEESNDQDNQE